jgi:hypothetical protein
MNKNERAIISAKDYDSNTDLENQSTMKNLTTTQYKFQYHCSFCACELHDDGLRFNGVGACPACDDLAHLWVKSLRQYAANYFNLGVKK